MTKKVIPPQRDLDKMTFKFIIKNDLQNNRHFNVICEYMFRFPERYLKEKDILRKMVQLLKAHDDLDGSSSSLEEEEYS